MKQIVWMVALLVLAGSCTNESERWLERAEVCIKADPACAYRCLQQIGLTSDGLTSDGLTDEERAKYALLQVQAMHKCRMPPTNDSLINVAVAYYQANNDKHMLAKALLYKGLVHKQNGQMEQAAEAFVTSERNFAQVDDNQYKALLSDHYGMLLFNQAMYEKALHYFKLTRTYEMQGDSAHYVVSTYRRMAMVYDLLGYRDSARTCYVEGLSYADEKGVRSRNYYLLLQNYASFLTEGEEFPEAEQLLLQCAGQLADSTYSHTLHSSLATLYYVKGEYGRAIDYAEKVLESKDSLTVCGGHLRLYKNYRDMGDLETAMRHHDFYRSYDNDLAERRKTAQVAALPYRVENRQLKAENLSWRQKQWRWTGMIVALLAVAGALFLLMRRRHQREQARFDIRSSEYLPLLKVLLAQENSTLHEKLDNCGLERNKLTMCYLIALGLDDINMMTRAAFLAPNSVKAYRKECREMVEALKSGSPI